MEDKEILQVKTSYGVLRYWRDWESDGAINMIEPKTIKTYQKIKGGQVDSTKYAVFFAFSNEQFDKGVAELKQKGLMQEGEKIYSYGAGLLGTKRGLDEYLQALNTLSKNMNKLIREQCDPQEVYFYEYNNYESMINWDGDKEAIECIRDIWGEDVADSIKRYSVYSK